MTKNNENSEYITEIEQQILNRLKYSNGGVSRDVIADEFDLRKHEASDVLRSLRYKANVKFRFDTGKFHCTLEPGGNENVE